MESSDKRLVTISGFIAAVCLAIVIGMTICNMRDNANELQKFEAATQVGLVQRIDPYTSRIIWVKPSE